MTEINIYSSITQSITNDVALFKNNEKSKSEFNKDLIIKMSLLLNLSKELKTKNESLIKNQKKELEKKFKEEEEKKVLHPKNKRDPFESSDEENNDEDYILNILINPTLQIYIPMAQTSYSLEDTILVKKKGKLIIDDNLINKKKELSEDFGNNIIDLSFEEPAIILDNKKIDNEKGFIDLLSNNDDDFNDNLDNRENINLKDLQSEDPVIPLENKNKNDISFVQTKKNYTISLNKVLNNEDFEMKNDFTILTNNNSLFKLPIKTYDYYYKQMHITYLNKMFEIYNKIKTKSDIAKYCEDKMFLNLTKIYLLKGGISDKKLYEDTLRNLVYKGENCDFESFLNCFLKILRLEDEQLIIKYKFLLYILADENKEEITLNQLKQYCNEILKCKMIYDEDLYNEIRTKIINKYNSLYKGEYQVFSLRNILLILETFFENK